MAWDDHSPIHRMRNYMENQGWWSDQEESAWKEKSKKNVCFACSIIRCSDIQAQ